MAFTAPGETDAVLPAVGDDVLHVVLRILEHADDPLSANQIHQQLSGPFRIPKRELEQRLAQAVEEGRIHSHGKFGRSIVYSDKSLDDFAPILICRTLSRKPLTESELKKAVKSRLRGFGEKRVTELLKALVSQKQVKVLPAVIGGRSNYYSAQPAEPEFYLADAVDKLEAKLEKHGVSKSDITAALQRLAQRRAERAAPPPRPVPAPISQSAEAAPAEAAQPAAEAEPADLPQMILDRMTLLDPQADRGAPVLVSELRKLHDFQHENRADFDRALWQLVREEKLALHQHDSIGSLPEEKRQPMLIDDEGRHFHLVSRRA